MRGFTISTFCPAISARRSRRMSSSLLPLNIGPQTTSSQPPRGGVFLITCRTITGRSDGMAQGFSADVVLEPRLARLRLQERDPARAEVFVELELDPVDLVRPGTRLGPEVARIGRVAAKREADQMILLVVLRPSWQVQLADLP